MVPQPTRVSFLAGILGLFTAFFAFIFAGGTSGKPPSDPPRPPLPSTLPPPAEPPGDASDEPPVPPRDPPAGPPSEPSGNASGEPLERVDMRSAIALARLYPTILRWLQGLPVAPQDVQDLAQQIVADALREWSSLVIRPGVSEAVGRLRWLSGVTRNRAFDHMDRMLVRARREVLGEDLDEAVDDTTPEDLFLAREAHERMTWETRLDRLRAATTPERWEAFAAHVIDGLPLTAVGAALGISAPTVFRRVQCAKADMRAAIERGRSRQRFHATRLQLRRQRKA